MTVKQRTVMDGVKLLLGASGAEFRRVFLLEWRYPLEAFSKLFLLFLFFQAIVWGGNLVGPAMSIEAFKMGQTERLVGYILFFLLTSAMQNGPDLIRQESELGVFEQVYLSRLSLSSIILIRGFTTVAAGLLPLTLLFAVGALTLSLEISQVSPILIVLIGLGTFGMQGVGLILSGIALLVKRVQTLMTLIMLFLLVVAVIPISQMPALPTTMARWFPFTMSIRLVSTSLLDQEIVQGDLLVLLVSSMALFVLGGLLFRYAERIALDRGFLGQY